MNAINGLTAAWQGIGAAWVAFWGILSPLGDQITFACVQATPQLCVWLDDGWMRLMGYHLLMNGLIFGSVNVWYCWKLYTMDKRVTWYYPNQGPSASDLHSRQDQTPEPDQSPEPDQLPRSQNSSGSVWARLMIWLGFE